METKKILFITQEMMPYVPRTDMSRWGRNIPQVIQNMGSEIRIFMPCWGVINIRRNQLHEVIRLSGMNIIINNSDHPLIIKVASVPSTRMHVYFIDNDDYFHSKTMMHDAAGNFMPENMERAIFYARGVLETIKKSGWYPDVICCQGWISSICPLFIKTAYRNEPPFMNAKVVFTGFDDLPFVPKMEEYENCMPFKDANLESVAEKGIDLESKLSLAELALAYSDGFIEASSNVPKSIKELAAKYKLKTLKYTEDTGKYNDFLQKI